MSSLDYLSISLSGSIRDAMKTISKNQRGLCFLINNSQKLVGVITDGDIRRFLLNGKTLDTKLNELVLKDFSFLRTGFTLSEAQEKVQKFKVIPVVDKTNKLVDYVSLDRLHIIPLISTDFSGKELDYVNDCLNSGWVSSIGSYVNKFQNAFNQKFGFNYSLCVSSGTTGLQLAFTTLGIGINDEVIVPNFTFAASINSIIHSNATPILVDVNSDSACVDIEIVKKSITKKTKAILLVHLYGNACNLDDFYKLREETGILIIEDCAEALGTRYKEKHVGLYSDAAIFSFFGNKLITTGEGGMVCFKDQNYYLKAKKLSSHGMDPQKRYWHEELGFNFRMTNIQAALGLGQIERIDQFIKAKIIISNLYIKYLSSNKSINLQQISPDVQSSYWLFTIFLNDNIKIFRDEIIDYLLAKGIETRPCFYPLNEMPPYKKYCNNDISNSINLAYAGISLPTSIKMTEMEVKFVCQELINAIKLFSKKKINYDKM